MKNWSDIQIAYLVAKHGSLSKAAEVLDVHHSTVLRHVDALEEKLSCKLFHRHTRGYTATDAGKILLSEAEETEARLERMIGKINGTDEQLSGPFIITSVSTLSPVLMPAVEAFARMHPKVDIQFQADPRIFKLEYGEAHVSIRPGAQPKDPDYVVQKLYESDSALYASAAYMNRFGSLPDIDNIGQHQFVSFINKMDNIASIKWIQENVPEDQISFKASDFAMLADAAARGLGMVALDCRVAKYRKDLIQMCTPPNAWRGNVWLVTHRDIHRSPKVQAFNTVLKEKFGVA